MSNFLVKAAAVLATAVTISVPAMAIEQGHPGGTTVTRVAFQQKLGERFAMFDANKDGTVTRAEYDAARTKMKGERRDARFAKLDADRDGRLTREEFAAPGDRDGGRKGAHMGGHKGRHGGGMGRLGGFAMMDTNKDGRATLAEATAHPLAAFDAADANKDGQVTPEERRAARINARAQWQAKRG